MSLGLVIEFKNGGKVYCRGRWHTEWPVSVMTIGKKEIKQFLTKDVESILPTETIPSGVLYLEIDADGHELERVEIGE